MTYLPPPLFFFFLLLPVFKQSKHCSLNLVVTKKKPLRRAVLHLLLKFSRNNEKTKLDKERNIKAKNNINTIMITFLFLVSLNGFPSKYTQHSIFFLQ